MPAAKAGWPPLAVSYQGNRGAARVVYTEGGAHRLSVGLDFGHGQGRQFLAVHIHRPHFLPVQEVGGQFCKLCFEIAVVARPPGVAGKIAGVVEVYRSVLPGRHFFQPIAVVHAGPSLHALLQGVGGLGKIPDPERLGQRQLPKQ